MCNYSVIPQIRNDLITIQCDNTAYKHRVVIIADSESETELATVKKLIDTVSGFENYQLTYNLEISLNFPIKFAVFTPDGIDCFLPDLYNYKKWLENGGGPSSTIILDKRFGLTIGNDTGSEIAIATVWDEGNPETWCSDDEDFSPEEDHDFDYMEY